MNELDLSDGGLPTPARTAEHPDSLSVTALRQHMIAMSVAAALCGAAAATATLLVLQSAGVHAACAFGGAGIHDGIEARGAAFKRERLVRLAACYPRSARYTSALTSSTGKPPGSPDCASPDLVAAD